MFQLLFGHLVEWRERAERLRAFQIYPDIVGKIGWTIGQIGRHLPNELRPVLDLHRPVQFPFLADERKRRIGNGASAKRTGPVCGINFHFVRKSENFVVQRIVELAGERARIFIRIAQVGPADVVHEKQVAGEDRDRLTVLADEKGKAVGRMSRGFAELDLERPDPDNSPSFASIWS